MVILAVTPKPDYATAATVVARMAADLAAARTRLHLTVAAQAKQIGVTTTTLTRLYGGSVPTQTTVLAGLRWLAKV